MSCADSKRRGAPGLCPALLSLPLSLLIWPLLVRPAHAAPPLGTTLADELVPLTRARNRDTAQREVNAPPGTTVVAIADERGTDVTLRVRLGMTQFEVENSQKGEGVEIAALAVPDGGRITIELHGPANNEQPGSVHLRVAAYTAQDLGSNAVAARVKAYQDWSRATTDMKHDDVPIVGNPRIVSAIAALESPGSGDGFLAAMARAVRARMFYEFEVDWHEARTEARRAAAAFLAAGVDDALNAARARRLEAAALQEVAHSSKETDAAKRAADAEARRMYAELIAAGSSLDAVGRARVYNDLGLMDAEAQAWESARANFDAARVLFHSAKYLAGELQTLRSYAFVSMQRGDYAAASVAYEVAIARRGLIADDDARASLLINAALADTNIGNSDRAIGRLLEARSIAEENSLNAPRRRALLGLGTAYWARGDVQQAESFFAAIGPLEKEVTEEGMLFNSLRLHGAMLRDAGNPRLALAKHRESLQIGRERRLLRARAQIEIARDYVALEDREHALLAIRAALAEERSPLEHPVMGEARLVLADVLVMGQANDGASSDEAAAIAGDALRRADAGHNLPDEIAARRVLARVALLRQRRAEAIRELERAIDLALKYSRSSPNPELQAATRASQQLLFRDYLDLQMAAPAPEAAQTRALRVLEIVRAMNFALARGARNARESSGIDALLDQLASRHVRMAELADRDAPDSRAIASLQLEMATLRAQIDRIRAAAAGASGEGSEFAATEALWKPVGRGQIQLSYSLGVARGYVWRRTPAGVRGWVLPGTAQAIRKAAAEAARVDRLQNPAGYDAAVLRLSAQLLPAGLIETGNTRVEIVADDELSIVPFGALQSPTDPGLRFAQTHVISMLPSLLAARPARAAGGLRRWQLVAIRGTDETYVAGGELRGSPLFPSLPNARTEVEAVRRHFATAERPRIRILEGGLANAEQIRIAMNEGADVMHFATHGLANLRHPLASLLYLPGGLLTAGQIQEWNGNVGLVFLSACETAVGPTRFAEGMPGLQRAFLRAGAENVVATLWPVEDRMAMEFAQQFYQELATNVTPAEALARTQRRWISSASTESAQKKTRRRVAAWGYVLYSR